MDSRFKPDKAAEDSQAVPKKRYCDKVFRKQLLFALKANRGEPDNIDKIRR